MKNALNWFEIPVKNFERAKTFYSKYWAPISARCRFPMVVTGSSPGIRKGRRRTRFNAKDMNHRTKGRSYTSTEARTSAVRFRGWKQPEGKDSDAQNVHRSERFRMPTSWILKETGGAAFDEVNALHENGWDASTLTLFALSNSIQGCASALLFYTLPLCVI